jgi:hypothetical protein
MRRQTPSSHFFPYNLDVEPRMGTLQFTAWIITADASVESEVHPAENLPSPIEESLPHY